MKLSSMRFKDYVWPHNPRTYEIGFTRDVAVHRVPFGAYVLQQMGRRQRILRGEGEFVGEGAYAEFKKLATVFYESTPGMLTHPLWDTAQAYFVSLRLKQEPREDYVSYSFEFWECYDHYREKPERVLPAAGAQGAAETYTVEHGDSFQSIARAHGLTTAALLALNPQIRNPNALRAGETLRVR